MGSEMGERLLGINNKHDEVLVRKPAAFESMEERLMSVKIKMRVHREARGQIES